MMFSPYPRTRIALVRYFYLPANKERQAEVIEVLNSCSEMVTVPMREEDVELQAFSERALTEREASIYSKTETWKLFSSWEELRQDHLKFGLSEEQLQQLLDFRDRFELHEELAA